MVLKDYTFFSYVFLATAVILFTGHAHGAGLCDNSPDRQVCFSIVYTRTDPRDATVAACHKLIYETKVATRVAQSQPKSLEIDTCINYFSDAILTVGRALNALGQRNYLVVTANINNTQNIYANCDYVYVHYGKTNPLARSTRHLKAIANVGAYLAGLIK